MDKETLMVTMNWVAASLFLVAGLIFFLVGEASLGFTNVALGAVFSAIAATAMTKRNE